LGDFGGNGSSGKERKWHTLSTSVGVLDTFVGGLFGVVVDVTGPFLLFFLRQKTIHHGEYKIPWYSMRFVWGGWCDGWHDRAISVEMFTTENNSSQGVQDTLVQYEVCLGWLV
jgi:hypothetical protein